jgi:hypothetical protein
MPFPSHHTPRASIGSAWKSDPRNGHLLRPRSNRPRDGTASTAMKSRHLDQVTRVRGSTVPRNSASFEDGAALPANPAQDGADVMGVSQQFVDLAVGAIAREKCHERRPPTRSELGACPARLVAPGCRRLPLRDGRPVTRIIKFSDRRHQREDCAVIGATVLQSRLQSVLGRGERHGQCRDHRKHQCHHLGDP